MIAGKIFFFQFLTSNLWNNVLSVFCGLLLLTLNNLVIVSPASLATRSIASKIDAVTFGIRVTLFSLTCDTSDLVHLETQLLINKTRKALVLLTDDRGRKGRPVV